MMKVLRTLSIACSLGTASAAFALPFGIQITSSPNAAGLGVWSLSGPSSAAETWAVDFGGTYSSGADVVAGEYTWSLFGGAIGVGSVSWTLTLNGEHIYSGSDNGHLAFLVSDSTGVRVSPVVTSVPEPGILVLMGTGLLGMALSVRRARRAVEA